MIDSEARAREYCEKVLADDPAALQRLEALILLLKAENQRQNLVSEASLAQVWQRHIADSLQLLEHIPSDAETWVDLGTGAGMPGLVIALARPKLQMDLVESRKRRAEWLQRICTEFALTHCTVRGSKLEDVETAPFDVISARAFAPLQKLFRLSTRFSTRETTWVLPKGRSAGIELEELPETMRQMFHVEPSRTDPQAGIIVGRGHPLTP